MQVLIVGTGAEGAWTGSRLIQAGIGTTFLVGTKERATELDRHGMVVRSSGDFFQSRVRAITHSEISQTFDAVLITSRAHRSSFALAAARPAIGSSTVVLPFRFDPIQMSILNEERIGITLCGVPTMTVKQLRDGSVSHGGDRTSISVGSFANSDRGIDIAQKVFRNSEIGVELSSDIKSEMWVKFAASAASAALQILLPFSSDWATSRRELAFREFMRETIRIGAASGLKPIGARQEPAVEWRMMSSGGRVEAMHNLMVMTRLAQDFGVNAPLLSRAYHKHSS